MLHLNFLDQPSVRLDPLDYDVKSLFVQEITVFPFLREHFVNIQFDNFLLELEMRNRNVIECLFGFVTPSLSAAHAVSRATSRGRA